ncbi:fibrobacter succinogenes major paralogous domain-containing protein [Flavobacterium sp. AS60]|uniref:fibrobacter succinogenes major paralogous domain-containing protein n=1 Tax=Flavobacterium anseongense TaxID=2910677 RepID=UPI001F418AB2|nr:fibrobacter succinogenes major paralogous domain-containing protein [Flavobacterium sp. AS60]MCF6128947.1 fibrobacter succinogenes major paralogous domain-containing protein [Flavobacterium sp. AS60]
MKKILIFCLVSVLLVSCASDSETGGEVIIDPVFSVQTKSVATIGHESANVFGAISPSFVTATSEYGICYGLSPNPTIEGSFAVGAGINPATGGFSCNLLSLMPLRFYYVRAYATTSEGTVYGNQLTFSTLNKLYINGSAVIDVDGNNYQSIVINGKQWMKGNLNVSKYRNGDVIPEVTDMAEWDALTTGAWCYFENVTANGTTYGKLYNWYAINDPRGLAPTGWHIPSDAEWTSLTNFLGGTSVAGMKMRDLGDTWSTSAVLATNQAGFSALPGGYGYLTHAYDPVDEPFNSMGDVAFWWSSTASNPTTAYSLNVNLNNSVTRGSILKKAALSVRCVRN